MAWKIGTVDSTGALAHYNMLETIADFLENDPALVAAGQDWEILRYDTTSANRELIVKGSGLSGTEEIFMGIRTYQSVPDDYYNFLLGVFTGYVSGNTFDTQPGARLSGVPAHNNVIEYWMTGNGQRLALCLKVGLPVYESGYIGKILPYAAPGQYPSPLVCGGMLNGAENTRFSDTAHSMPYKGAHARLGVRLPTGGWAQPECHPYNVPRIAAGARQVRPCGADEFHPLHHITLNQSTPRIYGVFDGIYRVDGFNNAVENVLQVGGDSVVDQAGMTMAEAVEAILAVNGRAFIVTQDVYRTGFNDFYAMEMS